MSDPVPADVTETPASSGRVYEGPAGTEKCTGKIPVHSPGDEPYTPEIEEAARAAPNTVAYLRIHVYISYKYSSGRAERELPSEIGNEPSNAPCRRARIEYTPVRYGRADAVYNYTEGADPSGSR